MEKSREFELIVRELKERHPDWHNFLEVLMAKIYPIWLGEQDKAKTHFIHLFGLDSKEDAEIIIADVLRVLGWIDEHFFKLLLSRVPEKTYKELLYMMLLHGGFAKVIYFPNAPRWIEGTSNREKGEDPIKDKIWEWFKNRSSLQLELDGKVYEILSSGNLVISWFDLDYGRNDFIMNEIGNFKIGDHGYPSGKEEFIQLPCQKVKLLSNYLVKKNNFIDAVDQNDFVFFLKDQENIIDLKNSLYEARLKFCEMASNEFGVQVYCSNKLDKAFLERWIGDPKNFDQLNNSYWDFLMTSFDFLKRTRRDFDSGIGGIYISREVCWKLALTWSKDAMEPWFVNCDVLEILEFDLPPLTYD